MRTSKYSEEQIIGFLRQAEAGMPIKELGRKHGFSDASFYKLDAEAGYDIDKLLARVKPEQGRTTSPQTKVVARSSRPRSRMPP